MNHNQRVRYALSLIEDERFHEFIHELRRELSDNAMAAYDVDPTDVEGAHRFLQRGGALSELVGYLEGIAADL